MSPTCETKEWVSLQNGLENLFLASAPLPIPGPSEVLVKICAVALNYRDTEFVMGLYNHHKRKRRACQQPPKYPVRTCAAPSSPPTRRDGREEDKVLSIFNQTHITGQVKAVHIRSGLGLPLPGVLMQYRVFDAEGLVRKPAYLSDEEAATLPIAAMTARMAVKGMRPLGQAGGKGEKVLVQGTGGVAVSGLQTAKASGAEVIITSSSDAKLELAKILGADKTINYKMTPDWDLEVLKLMDDEGVDIIFENGGAATLRKSRRNITLKVLLNGPRDRLEEMLAFYEERQIKPVVNKVFGFGKAKEALMYLFAGSHFGKVVVKVE
ncbi:hypothetical protein QTJ16_001810 [Diplocarpon rosae]|uniref:Enoyl reductase (ER) domain-containing protein n=1 Tax=Diplocarpon rosae TaxID=946125 RepID=A0AAD9T469_9HELO|nr:hypothetical protein QTJ16_001810 [Diplocarpon rosae]